MKRLLIFPPFLAAFLLFVETASAHQIPTSVRLLAVATAPGVPPFGEPFEVLVTLRVAPALTLAIPDTLPVSSAVESAGRAAVRGESPTAGDSVDVLVSYPAMAFLEGPVRLPSLTVEVSARGEEDRAGTRRSEVTLGVGEEGNVGVSRISYALGTIEVGRFTPLSEGAGSLEPRGPDDVLGGSWSTWDVVLTAGIALLGLGALVLRPRGTVRSGPEGSPSSGSSFGAADALAELDGILAEGWHRAGRIGEFYRAITDVLRRHSSQVEAAWGPWMTSTELADRLAGRWSGEASDRVARTVEVAERAKFAGQTPTVADAEEDWRTIRDWIARQGDPR